MARRSSLTFVRRLGFALVVLAQGACHRSTETIGADRTVAAPRTPSSATASASVSYSSTPLLPPCANARVFSSDAFLTLAVVVHGAIEEDSGQCEVGDEMARWLALGELGERTGEVERVYDPSRGDVFNVVSGSYGAGIYVRGAKSFVSYDWSPSPSEESALHAYTSTVKLRRLLFFRSTSRHFAAVSEADGVTLHEMDGSGWRAPVFEDLEPGSKWTPLEVRAVIDLNDDGTPELIEHFNEYADGRGFEIVVQRQPSGDWIEVADNEDTGP